MKKDNVNSWIVITGAPSSGKTTLLKELEKRGYKVFYEWARIYIDREIKKGKTLKEIRGDEFSFQKKVLKLKINFEKKLPKNKLIFMERSIPDTTAFMEMCGFKNDPTLKKSVKKCFYNKVFLLELVKYEKDYARTESKEEVELLETLLEKSYRDLGMEVIRIPKLSVQKRVNFVLERIK